MRILYWTELFWPHIGGVEVVSRQLIDALQNRNHEFLVVSSHSGHKLPDASCIDDISIRRFHFQKALANRDLRALRTIKQDLTTLKQAFQPDIVHINSSQPSLFFHQITASSCPAPTLFTIHEPPMSVSDPNSVLGRTLHSARWVAAVSEAMLQQARRLVPEIEPRSSVIYNALETPHLHPAPLPFDPPLLLCMGRLVEVKGFDLALRAFPILLKQFPKARLVIVGDGPIRGNLEELAAQIAPADTIRFTGWIQPEKIPDIINTATAVIVPSRWSEPFGLVALQAAQMARPVVAACVGGLPEIIVHGKTGLLVAKENSLALAESISFLLRHPEDAVRMGEEAMKKAHETFGMERFANEYDALYHRLQASAGEINRAEPL